MMASCRDLVSIFVALEFLSIPAYMLAAWRKRDRQSNEAGVKYYLLGVFASGRDALRDEPAVRRTGTTLLTDLGEESARRLVGGATLAVVFVIVGFGVQGLRGAVPPVGAGHLRGRADAGHRVLRRSGRRRRASSPS